MLILFVDDEPFYVDSYVEELKDAGFEVSEQKTVVAAMKILEDEKQKVSLIVTDVMMPSGNAFRNEDAPRSDLETGFAFYEWVRARFPEMPVVVLTNATQSRVDDKFATEKNCWLFRKHECFPTDLVQHIEHCLGVKKAI